MGLLDGKVAVVTGAGRGIGRGARPAARGRGRARRRERPRHRDRGRRHRRHARPAGRRRDRRRRRRRRSPTATTSRPGTARARSSQQAVDEFGRLDIVVNNAGILRDAMSFNITEAEWDSVIEVHLKGHLATCHHAVKHWRALGKAGEEVSGRIINTASESGLYGQAGPDQLRDREGRHRLDDDRARPRDEEVRRDRQRRVPARAHAHDRDGRRRGRVHERPRVGAREHLAARRVPRERRGRRRVGPGVRGVRARACTSWRASRSRTRSTAARAAGRPRS